MGAAPEKPATKDSLDDRYRRIYAAVAAIPRGRVASYGQVAEQAGMPGRARLVGRALAQCPARIPWHRVLNAAGRISLPPGSASYLEQVRRLTGEGVSVIDGKVAALYMRQPEQLDELLWGPGAVAAGARPRRAGSRR